MGFYTKQQRSDKINDPTERGIAGLGQAGSTAASMTKGGTTTTEGPGATIGGGIMAGAGGGMMASAMGASMTGTGLAGPVGLGVGALVGIGSYLLS